MAYIRGYYGVPAKRGGRVKFQGHLGTITSASSQYLYLRLDTGQRVGPCHPTWEMEYL